MKKIIAITLLLYFLGFNSGAFALNEGANVENSTLTIPVDAPAWEDYVAPKYKNPRTDFSKSASITELSIGAVLTSLILTAPVGIPMVIHGTTKVKMVSYANRKRIFDEKMAEAITIEDPALRAKEYEHILKRCHLKESTKRHYEKKYYKQQQKLAKKQAKELKKQAKKSK